MHQLLSSKRWRNLWKSITLNQRKLQYLRHNPKQRSEKLTTNVDEYGQEESATNDKDGTESLDTSDEETQNYHSSDIDNDIVVEDWYNMPCAYLCLQELQRFSWKLMFEAPLTPSPHSKKKKKKKRLTPNLPPPPHPPPGVKINSQWNLKGRRDYLSVIHYLTRRIPLIKKTFCKKQCNTITYILGM